MKKYYYSNYPSREWLFILLLSISLNNSSYGQNIFQIFKENVGLLEYSYKDTTSIGTGTIICKPLNKKRDSVYIFIVTNKHVLPDFDRSNYIEFNITNPDSSKNTFIKLAIPIYKDDGKYNENVIASKDEDLAIIEIGDQFRRSGLSYPNHHLIGIDYLADRKLIKNREIGIGDMVFFMGYPSFFFEKYNLSPVFRTGFIATDPLQSYHFNQFLKNYFRKDVLNGFLIDGNVFGGSSGSLVCLFPTPITQTSDFHPMLLPGKGTAWILGILTESYYDIGTKDAYSQRLNIGGVISSEKIIELINNSIYGTK